jgi:hypothetical protein
MNSLHPPGRELDTLVAKVEGWTWDERQAVSPRGSKYSRLALDPWWWLPFYSTNIAAAFQVMEKLHASGYVVILSNTSDSPEDSKWSMSIYKSWKGRWTEQKPTALAQETGDTAAHVICLAALKALHPTN